VSTLNHLWTTSRRELVRRACFGLEKIIEFDAPREWPSTGFQLGMVLLTRGYHGPCAVEASVSDQGLDAVEWDRVGR